MRVLVIGDSCVDVTRFCTFQRWSPEDPRCPVLWEDRQDISLGGAANVARWLAADSRLKVSLATPRGQDNNSVTFRLLCHEAGVGLVGNLYSPAFAMSIKERIVVEDVETRTFRQGGRIDSDDIGTLAPCDVRNLDNAFRSEHWDALVCVDYDKRVFRGSIGTDLLDAINQFSGPVFANSKCPMRWTATHLTALVCNHHELHESLKCDSSAQGLRHAERLMKTDCLVVTQGARGATAVLEDALIHEDSLEQHAVDVCGAGDAFLAGFVRAALRGREMFTPNRLVDLIEAGQRCAAWCVGQIGVGNPLVETGEGT